MPSNKARKIYASNISTIVWVRLRLVSRSILTKSAQYSPRNFIHPPRCLRPSIGSIFCCFFLFECWAKEKQQWYFYNEKSARKERSSQEKNCLTPMFWRLYNRVFCSVFFSPFISVHFFFLNVAFARIMMTSVEERQRIRLSTKEDAEREKKKIFCIPRLFFCDVTQTKYATIYRQCIGLVFWSEEKKTRFFLRIFFS